jgi:hypothetical protein
MIWENIRALGRVEWLRNGVVMLDVKIRLAKMLFDERGGPWCGLILLEMSHPYEGNAY